MKHTKTRPCQECPFTGRMPGWIGAHKDAAEFVEMARNDSIMPCHMSIDYERPGWRNRVDKAESCVGQLAFMNKLHKLSRTPEVSAHQCRLSKRIKVVWPPEKLIALHNDARAQKGLQ